MLTHPWLIKTNLSCIDKKFLTIICSIEEVKNIAYLYLPDGCWRDMHVVAELMLMCRCWMVMLMILMMLLVLESTLG